MVRHKYLLLKKKRKKKKRKIILECSYSNYFQLSIDNIKQKKLFILHKNFTLRKREFLLLNY